MAGHYNRKTCPNCGEKHALAYFMEEHLLCRHLPLVVSSRLLWLEAFRGWPQLRLELNTWNVGEDGVLYRSSTNPVLNCMLQWIDHVYEILELSNYFHIRKLSEGTEHKSIQTLDRGWIAAVFDPVIQTVQLQSKTYILFLWRFTDCIE